MKQAEQGRSGIFLLNAVLLIHCSKTRMISSKLQIIRVFFLFVKFQQSRIVFFQNFSRTVEQLVLCFRKLPEPDDLAFLGKFRLPRNVNHRIVSRRTKQHGTFDPACILHELFFRVQCCQNP